MYFFNSTYPSHIDSVFLAYLVQIKINWWSLNNLCLIVEPVNCASISDNNQKTFLMMILLIMIHNHTTVNLDTTIKNFLVNNYVLINLCFSGFVFVYLFVLYLLHFSLQFNMGEGYGKYISILKYVYLVDLNN